MDSTSVWAFAAFSILMAAVARGYAGFGFSMIAIMLLSLVLPPAKTVPAILLLEIAASVWLLPQVWKKIHWRSLVWLSVGVVITTPLGAYLLAVTPPRHLNIAIAVAVLASSILLGRGFSLKVMPNKAWTVLIGMATGLLNGAAALGGPPVILFYFSSPAGVDVSRASLIAYFFFTDCFALGANAVGGLVNGDTLLFGAAMAVPLLLGLIIGSRSYARTSPETFKKAVLLLLAVLSTAVLIRSLFGES